MSVDSQLLGAPYGAATRNPFSYVKAEQIGRDVVTPWLTLDEITNQINLFEDERFCNSFNNIFVMELSEDNFSF